MWPPFSGPRAGSRPAAMRLPGNLVTNIARIGIVLLFVAAMTSIGWAAARLYEPRSGVQDQAAMGPGLIRTGAAIEESPGGAFALIQHPEQVLGRRHDLGLP